MDFIWHDPESDKEDFEAIVPSLVEGDWLTRENLDEVRDDLRPIAEAELDRQGIISPATFSGEIETY